MSDSRANVCSLPFFANEYWFARRLMRHGIDISGGVTTSDQRRERARRGICGRGLATARVVLNKPDTFAECFERLYGEALIQREAAEIDTEMRARHPDAPAMGDGAHPDPDVTNGTAQDPAAAAADGKDFEAGARAQVSAFNAKKGQVVDGRSERVKHNDRNRGTH